MAGFYAFDDLEIKEFKGNPKALIDHKIDRGLDELMVFWLENAPGRATARVRMVEEV